MIELAKGVYRKIKYSLFTTREKEFLKHHKRRQESLISAYLKSHDVCKLQIGAQSNSIGEWLNVDIHPKSESVAYMDATERFPFEDNTFDYVFSEHMIEHITFQQGRFMLTECFRVLKKGGTIRISTPDLAFLIQLYQQQKSNLQTQYIHFSTERYFKNQSPEMDTLVINNFMRDWGHQFVHDQKSLFFLLSKAGFESIRRCEVNQSENIHLRNIEQHGKEITDEFNLLESIVVEGTKPM